MHNSKMMFSFVVLIALLVTFSTHEVFAQSSFSVETLYEPGIEAVTSFATSIAETAPKIIAASILLLIGLVVGKVFGKVISKTALKFLQKTKLQNDDLLSAGTSNQDSSKLIASSVRWFIYLFFIIAAINALEFEQLSTALTDLWLWVPNLLAFILIIVVGLIVATFIGKWLDQELVKSNFGGSKYVKIGVKGIIYAVIFAVGLTQLGIGQQIIPILVSAFSWSIAIGIGAAIAIGLGFTFKEIFPAIINTASKQRSVLKVGQKVRIGNVTGTLTAVELLHVIVATENNESIIIPTKELGNSNIVIMGTVNE
ncbi:mechanosensitive ion channel family protein [Nitrosopumilus adriaticus]|nr:mechanosensitive ion channel domain-containing protein [Nitrosopumilus adriaticus]